MKEVDSRLKKDKNNTTGAGYDITSFNEALWIAHIVACLGISFATFEVGKDPLLEETQKLSSSIIVTCFSFLQEYFDDKNDGLP